MDALIQDLCYGLRGLWSRKGHSLTVMLTLGLAIGANTTLFSLVSTVLFATIPFEDPDSIVFLWSRNESLKRFREPSSAPEFVDLRSELQSFRELAAWKWTRRALTGSAEPFYVQSVRATANFFPATGVSVARGRFYVESEERPEASAVVLLSHGAWERRFGADPTVLGTRIELDGEGHTIIGILSPEMELGPFSDVEVWTPLGIDFSRARRDERDLYVVGRLAPGATFDRAALEVESTSKRLAEAHPETSAGWSLFAQPFTEALIGPNWRTITLLLTMTVGFVLFIGCANVAHILLARVSGRRREIQVRAALGATRVRLLRQLLTESLVLSIAGSLWGLTFTYWTLRALEAITRERIPLFTRVEIDPTVLGFALVMGFLTPILFGLVPALRLSGEELRERAVTLRSSRPRQILIAGEVALAMVLLIVAGLSAASIRAIRDIDLGLRPENVLTLNLELPSWKYSSEDQRAQFFDDVLASVASLPGVRVASLSSQRPIEGSAPNQSFVISGRPEPEPQSLPSAAKVTVSPRFFSTLGIELLEGRDFSSGDVKSSNPVAIVSRAARDRYWPTSSPVGSGIRIGDGEWLDVVGTVSDVRNSDADQPPEPHIYLPFGQNRERAMSLLLRSEGDPLALVSAVRAAIQEIDPAQPIEDVRTMEQIAYDDLASDFAVVGLMGYFTLVALGLATAGIGGVVSHSVSERSQEIGIRMALGAEARQILFMVLRQGMIPVAGGILLGFLGSLALSRLISSLLYGISATDLRMYVAMGLLLTLVAFVASLAPALRAAWTDPVSTLRGE